ncbi:MAG: Ornithine carbamoyltransferase [Candidatus Syntrophoarchaeum butanivorans]|uniref:Ornithine carbamoyltransferase n=3 Tax=Candidatus Syntropharchaeum butanivorans TaxID=1839936 RepID=A0A1F2P4C5_9EURY|nr:MAG: Ornithine carbamoyltransferase [Candidatus Syntrophoarchaeum butanivorans]
MSIFMSDLRHLISILDLDPGEIHQIVDDAISLKRMRKDGVYLDDLRQKSLAMIFEKPSTRTRVSFEVAMTELGGHALYLGWNDLQLGRGEAISDTARVLSSYVHAIMIRSRSHETILELARYSKVPVINGLSDLEHPCQLLADLTTIRELKGGFEGLKLGWIGDGNNVCNSAILASALVGMEIVVATPPGYGPDRGIIDRAIELGGKLTLTDDPEEAANGADILYTDVWVSMGDEDERDRRMRDFSGYRIDEKLIELSDDRSIIMHCLPAHRGEEITDGVIEGPRSVVFHQAENRLHAQKALLLKLLG